MRRRIWSVVAAALLLCASASPTSARTTLLRRPVTPLECVESVALSVAVEDPVRFSGPAADLLERQLLVAASGALTEAGVASDPRGRDVHIDVVRELDELLVVLSPRGEKDPGSDREEDWQVPWTVQPKNAEAMIASDVEEAVQKALAVALGWIGNCQPTRYSSAHDRFAFELPPKNPDARSRYLRAVHGEKEGEFGALFERLDDGREALRSTFPLPPETLHNKFLVSDDGLFVVAVDPWSRVGIGDENVLVLLRSDGTKIRALSREDLLTPSDVEQTRRTGMSLAEPTLNDELDRLTVPLSIGDLVRTIEIDLATGEPIVPKRDLVPYLGAVSGVYAPRAELAMAFYRGGTWSDPVCVGEPVDFEAADLVREPPGRFYGRSVARPLPEYTELATRARLTGTVDVEVVVAATGEVICARVTYLPMGLSKAVESVATRWRFRPAFRDGQPLRSIGRFSIHFGTIDPLGEL